MIVESIGASNPLVQVGPMTPSIKATGANDSIIGIQWMEPNKPIVVFNGEDDLHSPVDPMVLSIHGIQ